MPNSFKKILFLILFCICYSIHGQELITKSLSEIAELPDKEFYDVLIDSKGNYWFCADTGLYKFDGVVFKHYTNKIQRSQSLFNLKEDELGRIWCNSLNGQFFYLDPEKDKLEFFVDVSKDMIGRLPEYELYENYLIVKLDGNNLFQFDFNTKKKSKLSNIISNLSNVIKWNDDLYFYYNRLLTKINPKTNTTENYPKSYLRANMKLFLLNNTIYILDYADGFKLKDIYVFSNRELINLKLPKNLNLKVYDIFKNSNDFIFFSTEKGVYVMKEINQEFVLQYKLLPNTKVSKIIEDKFGNYIFTTLNQGIFYWNGQEDFKIQPSQLGSKSEGLRFIKKWKSNTFLLTDYKNVVYELNNGNEIDIKKKFKVNKEINHLFVLNQQPYLVYGEKNIAQINNRLNPSFSNDFSSIKDICYYDDTFYVADTYSLESLNHLTKKSPINKLIREKRCMSVAAFNNNIYGAFADGVFQINNGNYAPINYNNAILYGDKLFTGEKYLWILKKNQGLFFLSKNEVNEFRSFKGKGFFLKETNNNLYCITNEKLYKINEENLTLDLIKDLSSLLQEETLNDFEVTIDNCIITTNKGLLYSSLKQKNESNDGVSTHVNIIYVNEKKVDVNKLQTLSYNENSIKLFLRNNDIVGRDKYTFRYKINDASENWQTINDLQNPIYLSYLSPSTYNVNFQTLQNNKVIHENTLSFSISNPFWKTWWFGLSVFGVSISIILALTRLYLSKIQTKQKFELEQLDLEKNLAEAKLQNLTSQMNPHFTFNALNTVQGLILDDKKQEAYTYLAHFSNLFRKSIDFSSKAFNTFDEEIKFLETYLKIEAKRFNNELIYTINDDDLEDRFYKIPAMILQPFLENGIKHGLLHKKGDKRLSIDFINSDTEVNCIITDNGIGRKAASKFRKYSEHKHLNMATSSVQKRFELYKKHHQLDMSYNYKDLLDSHGKSLGTQVTITIPLIK